MRVKITLRCNECKQRNYNSLLALVASQSDLHAH